MKTLLHVTVVMAALALVPILSCTSTAQGSFDRDGCLRGCAALKPVGRGMGGWAAYQSCVADCERQFWNEFDEKIDDLERERDKD
jgi:hypothetical protein